MRCSRSVRTGGSTNTATIERVRSAICPQERHGSLHLCQNIKLFQRFPRTLHWLWPIHPYVPHRRGAVSKRDTLIQPPVLRIRNPVQICVPFTGLSATVFYQDSRRRYLPEA